MDERDVRWEFREQIDEALFPLRSEVDRLTKLVEPLAASVGASAEKRERDTMDRVSDAIHRAVLCITDADEQRAALKCFQDVYPPPLRLTAEEATQYRAELAARKDRDGYAPWSVANDRADDIRALPLPEVPS